MEHKTNKGANRGVEFSGLQAQYLYVLAGDLLSVSLVLVTLYTVRVSRQFCILLGTVPAPILALMVFCLGRRCGPRGLMRLAAAECRSSHIISHKCIISLLR